MFTHNQEELYKKIAKVCRVSIPILYILIVLLGVALFFIPLDILSEENTKIILNNIEIDLTKMSTGSKYILIIGIAATIGLAIRMLWLVINIFNRFKHKEIFSEGNARLANKAAVHLLLIVVSQLALNFYLSVLTGDLKLDIIEKLATVAFAYLSAWILNIGYQLKTENDLTV